MPGCRCRNPKSPCPARRGCADPIAAGGVALSRRGWGARLMFTCAALLLFTALPAQPEAPVHLFNGRDLTGWVNVNGAGDTWQVRDGLIVTSGVPRGVLRTEQM